MLKFLSKAHVRDVLEIINDHNSITGRGLRHRTGIVPAVLRRLLLDLHAYGLITVVLSQDTTNLAFWDCAITQAGRKAIYIYYEVDQLIKEIENTKKDTGCPYHPKIVNSEERYID
ncbi:hypothetical protein MMKA1_p-00070 (plasmid) [Methanococcus maripaludis KA1]|uniref:Uncharacterized protein n=1 Tax=Methanococcus maripaludis KA1 TaxID=637914 RepID=A0A2Z5PFT0_METMI|nr:hypothetical protein [Methanococcus maripaludis]BAP62080.1 hypothetical protein MMKA1_p-00070 [Methanococcus maripaludis KA1]